MKKQRGKTFAFIMFNSIEEREEAKSLLETIQVGGKHLTCKDVGYGNTCCCRQMRKRSVQIKNVSVMRMRMELENVGNLLRWRITRVEIVFCDELDKTTNDVVAPWWNVPYEEQTSRKEREMRQVLKRCNRRLSRKDSDAEKKAGRAGSVKQPCRDFMSNGSCMYGDRCKYLHLTMDEWEAQLKSERRSQEKQGVEGISTEQAKETSTEQAKETSTEQTKETSIKQTKETSTEQTKETSTEQAKETSTEQAETEKIRTSDIAAQGSESSCTPRRETEQTCDKNENPSPKSDAEEYERTNEEEGQLCTMLPILTHPAIHGYRNKCTFTIGKNREGSPCIGFRMGSFIDGNVVIGEVELLFVPSDM